MRLGRHTVVWVSIFRIARLGHPHADVVNRDKIGLRDRDSNVRVDDIDLQGRCKMHPIVSGAGECKLSPTARWGAAWTHVADPAVGNRAQFHCIKSLALQMLRIDVCRVRRGGG